MGTGSSISNLGPPRNGDDVDLSIPYCGSSDCISPRWLAVCDCFGDHYPFLGFGSIYSLTVDKYEGVSTMDDLNSSGIFGVIVGRWWIGAGVTWKEREYGEEESIIK